MNTPEETTEVEAKRIVVRDNTIPPKLGGHVHYVLAERDSVVGAGRVRPAIIVDLVEDGSPHGLVSLQVFTNGGFDQLPSVQHCKEILHDEETRKPGTWHWPPPRELVFKSVDVQPQATDPIEVLRAELKKARTSDEAKEIEAKLNALYDAQDAQLEAEKAAAAHPVAFPPPLFKKDVAERETEPFQPDSEEETEDA